MSAEAVLGQLNDAAGRVENFPNWLNEQVNRATTIVNALLNAVPFYLEHLVGQIVDQARALLARIGELAREFVNWLNEHVIPFLTGPFTLHSTGDEWTTTVFAQATEVSGRMNLSETSVDDYWGGPAASAYRSVIPRQRAAAEQVSDAISKLREAIQSLAWSLAGLYIALAALIALVTVKIIAAIAAKATVVGIPPGLVAFVSAVLAGIGGAAAILTTGKEVVSGSAEQLATLLELQHDSTALDGGTWPQATSDLGDPGKWSPQQW